MAEKQEFCWNSRRWVIWMTMDSSIPWTCPNKHNGGSPCIGSKCGYHEMREPTQAFKRRERMIREFYGTDDDSAPRGQGRE